MILWILHNIIYFTFFFLDVGQNLFFSPISIFSASVNLLAGCRGDSESELKHALAVGDKPNNESLHKGLGSALNEMVKCSEGCTIEMANRLYLDNNFQLKTDYIKLVGICYGVSPENVGDF